MMEDLHFEITEDHMKLLARMSFSYNDYCEFGAPEVNPKRPYGNSAVYHDIAELIGIEPEEKSEYDGEYDFSEAQQKSMLKLHKEMQTVLQIGANTKQFSAGKYTSDWTGHKWKAVPENLAEAVEKETGWPAKTQIADESDY